MLFRSISIRRSNSRDSGGTAGEMARITITMMQEFDKLPNDVIVIGATNRKDRIDEALLRRFSIKHEVKVLNKEEKTEMVKKYLTDVGITFPDSEIEAMVDENANQSVLLNEMIRRIARKIAEEL